MRLRLTTSLGAVASRERSEPILKAVFMATRQNLSIWYFLRAKVSMENEWGSVWEMEICIGRITD